MEKISAQRSDAALAVAGLLPEFQAVLARLLEKLDGAAIDHVPDQNIYIEDVFTPEIYAKILRLLPNDAAYDFIDHPDAVLPDGAITRKLLDLTDDTLPRFSVEGRDFWYQMKCLLTSDVLLNAITQKFRTRINAAYGDIWPEMVATPVFYRDFPGYFIRIHPDAAFKVATMQFYFPADMSQLHLGTTFNVQEGETFREHKTNQFKPNSAYAFVRSEHSWHSVRRIGPHEQPRNTLALTIYIKGSEYKSAYRPGEY